MLIANYGSNLNLEQWRTRCPSARLVGVGELRGWRLTFTGSSRRWGGAVATVMRVPQGERARVPVAVYELRSPRDVRTLDACEGFPRVYDCQEVTVYMPRRKGKGSRRVKAWTYVKRNQDEGWPSNEYAAKVAQGYKDHGLDLTVLAHALATLPPAPPPPPPKPRKPRKRERQYGWWDDGRPSNGNGRTVRRAPRVELELESTGYDGATETFGFVSDCSTPGCHATVVDGCPYCDSPDHCASCCPDGAEVFGGSAGEAHLW